MIQYERIRTCDGIEEVMHDYGTAAGFEAANEIRVVKGERVEKIIGFPELEMRITNVILPDNTNVELIEYVSPKGKKIDLSTCNPGVAHVGFVVDDVEKTYQEWKARGVEFVYEPQWASAGALKGWGISYFRGPDGITMEIMEAPKGVKLHPATGCPIED